MNPQIAQINAHINIMVQEDTRNHGIRAILQQHFKQNNQERPAEWLDHHAEFLRSYIQFAPNNLQVMWNAANERGKSAEFEPIAKMLIAYYYKADDHIPDRFGIWGWLDDAYLSNYTMELINQKCRDQLGYYLIDFDFQKCNSHAAPFLGNTLQALQNEARQSVNKQENWNAVEAFAGALLGGLLLYSLMGGNNTSNAQTHSGGYSEETNRMYNMLQSNYPLNVVY